VGVGLVLWVLVWFCGRWFGFVGVGLVLWVLVWFCGCWFRIWQVNLKRTMGMSSLHINSPFFS
jgi:hypothetical protein